MSFVAPLNLLWAVPAVGLVTLLYMLRRPRRDIVVPSTVMWRTVSHESAQVKRLQKLTPQLLYFLQLFAAVLLVIAAAQPQLRAAATAGQCVALIVDNGLTMQTRSSAGGATRFGDAQRAAVDAIGADRWAADTFCVLTTSPPKLIVPPTADKTSATQAVKNMTPSDAPSDPAGAAEIAGSALRQQIGVGYGSARAVFFSDGCWNGAADQTGILRALNFASPTLDLISSPPDQPRDIGIRMLAVQRDPVQPAAKLQIFVGIDAQNASTGSCRLQMRASGRVLLTRRVNLAERRDQNLSFTLPTPPTEEGLIAEVTNTGPDDLKADDAAYAVLPAAGAARVLVIGGASGVDPGLERVLSLLPQIQVDETRLDSVLSTGVPAGYSAYVLDNEPSGAQNGAVPVLPGSSLVFSASGDTLMLESASPDVNQIVDWDRSSPILRFADFSGASLAASAAWQSVGAWRPLIESQRGIVAAAQDRGGGGERSVRFSFSPHVSGFDKLASFPIVVSDAIDWLIQAGGSGSATAGAPILLAPTTDGWTVTRQSGDGQSQTVGAGLCDENSSPCSASETNLAGLYAAHSSAGDELFARSAAPAASLTPKLHPLLPAYRRDSPGASSGSRTIHTSLLALAAALCLLALIVEWWAATSPNPVQYRAV